MHTAFEPSMAQVAGMLGHSMSPLCMKIPDMLVCMLELEYAVSAVESGL